MRACIVGGGLAGSLLAWRLVQEAPGWELDLVAGPRDTDATTASGGAVRAYESEPAQRRLALASLVELLASPVLRQWSDYRRSPTVSLRPTSAGLAGAVGDIELMLPGSAEVVNAAELTRRGWAGVGFENAAVLERESGYVSPARWRDAVLAECDAGGQVRLRHDAARAIAVRDGGGVSVTLASGPREYDLVLVAAGAWTGALLRAGGLPHEDYRTKSIQYALHRAGQWRPPTFVDGVTGLYGRPTEDGGLLLGLPTENWDVEPGRGRLDGALLDAAAEQARLRFPQLRLGPATGRVAAVDCYCDPPVLALRTVADTGAQVRTFTGGSGGCVKTALAASHRAAVQLVTSGPSEPGKPLTSAGRRKGQP